MTSAGSQNSYILPVVNVAIAFSDTSMGSADDGKFFTDPVTVVQGIGVAAAEGTACNGLNFVAHCYNVRTAFAAASVNTCVSMSNGVVPADAVTVTLTASGTGVFSNTGSMRVEQFEDWVIRFNSNDGTDPATIQSRGYSIQND